MAPILLSGIVVHGQQLGRRLGFPTANLSVASLQGTIPPTGVYAALCTLPNGQCYKAMVNVGYRPTVSPTSSTLTIESHLLQFDGDLYDQLLHLKLVGRIRDERKMHSLDELKTQLAVDLLQVANYKL